MSDIVVSDKFQSREELVQYIEQQTGAAVEKGLVHDRRLRDWLRQWCCDPFAELVA